MNPFRNVKHRAAGGRLRRYEQQFLPAALEILETPASPAGRAVAATICLFLTGALTWSILGRVDIVATAEGTVIPAGRSKLVQPLEAGVVRSIRVQDGAHVAAGQVLIRLDITAAAAERDRLARDLLQARLDAAGLRALRDALDKQAEPVRLAATWGGEVGDPAAPELVATEQARITARHAEQAAKLAGLAQQIAAKEAEAAENRATIQKLAASLPFAEQKRDLYRSLLYQQFANRAAWLDAEEAFSDQAHSLDVQRAHDATLAADIAALERQQEETKASYAKDLLKDLSEAEQRAAELAQQSAAAAHKAAQTVLTAPIAGTVQQLAVHTVGGVVTPAERLMTIVPDAAPVLIEATVLNRDVGFVHAGQKVAVKVETFSFTRYGLLHGRVVDVSRDSVADDAGVGRRGESGLGSDGDQGGAEGSAAVSRTPSYVAHIALDRTTLIVDGREMAVAPGMAVTAEIKTGRRRVIGYLLSPLQRYAHEGLRER